MKIAKPDVLVNLFGREVEPTFHISFKFYKGRREEEEGVGGMIQLK